MLVSCGTKQEKVEGLNEFTFEKSITTINMEIPSGWLADKGYNGNINPYADTVTFLRISNDLKYSVNSANGVEFDLISPSCTKTLDINALKKVNDKLFGSINTVDNIKCGNNYLYLSKPPKNGFVYIDKILVMPIIIYNWPRNGVTPEILSFFTSLQLK